MKTLHTRGKKTKCWVAPSYGCSLSLGKATQRLPMDEIPIGTILSSKKKKKMSVILAQDGSHTQYLLALCVPILTFFLVGGRPCLGDGARHLGGCGAVAVGGQLGTLLLARLSALRHGLERHAVVGAHGVDLEALRFCNRID